MPERSNGTAEDRSLTEILEGQVERTVDLLPGIAAAVAVFLVFLVIGLVIGRLVELSLLRRGDRVHARFIGRLPAWLFGFLGVIVGTSYLGLERVATGLLAGGGATAIILGFAFRQIGENFLAGLFLVFSRPFRLGDLIRSGDLPEGTVQSVDLRNTHVRTADGRDVFIPNARIFNDPLVNFTRDGLRRPTFIVGVNYHCELGELRAAILAAVSAVSGILRQPEPRVMIVDLAENHVRLEVSVWIDTAAGTDFAQAQTDAMEACRRVILEREGVISADVATALALAEPVEARLTQAREPPAGG